MIPLIIIGVVIALLLIFILISYNKLVSLNNKVTSKWANLDASIKKRTDLIPNLVDTVKGYKIHEQETLEKVMIARNKVNNAKTSEEENESNNQLSHSLGKLMAVVESYPDLKASVNFKELQTDLKKVEDDIMISRQIYNDTVLEYNNGIEQFPIVIITKIFKYQSKTYLEFSNLDNVKVEI